MVLWKVWALAVFTNFWQSKRHVLFFFFFLLSGSRTSCSAISPFTFTEPGSFCVDGMQWWVSPVLKRRLHRYPSVVRHMCASWVRLVTRGEATALTHLHTDKTHASADRQWLCAQAIMNGRHVRESGGEVDGVSNCHHCFWCCLQGPEARGDTTCLQLRQQ